MTDKQTQADDGRKGGSEDESRGSDLSALVRNYRDQVGDGEDGKTDGGEANILKAIQPVVDYAKRQMTKDERAEVEDSIDKAYKFVTGEDTLKGMNKTIVRGFLEAYALENPQFSEAFQNQRKDPETWQKALAQGRDWVKGQYQELTKGASKSSLRSDLEAAKAAVAGSSTDDAGEEKVDVTSLFSMSDSEFNKMMAQDIAKASR